MIYYLVRCSSCGRMRYMIFDRLGECRLTAEDRPGLFARGLSLTNPGGKELAVIGRTPTPAGCRFLVSSGGKTLLQVWRRLDGGYSPFRLRSGERWIVQGDARTGEYALQNDEKTVLSCRPCWTPQGRQASMLEIGGAPLAAISAAVILAELPMMRSPLAVTSG